MTMPIEWMHSQLLLEQLPIVQAKLCNRLSPCQQQRRTVSVNATQCVQVSPALPPLKRCNY